MFATVVKCLPVCCEAVDSSAAVDEGHGVSMENNPRSILCLGYQDYTVRQP